MIDSEKMCQCQSANCGYIYNKVKGDRKNKVKAGTDFNNLPGEWKCPICGASKKMFKSLC